MSGIYTIPITALAVAAAGQVDLVEITAAAAKPCVIIGFGLSQTTKEGDANEAILSVLVKSGQTTSGSGGSAGSAVALDASVGAASFAAEIGNTTKASVGTIVTHYAYNWNIRAPLDIILPEPMQIILPASRRLTIELAENAPTGGLTINGYVVVQEVG